MNKYPKIRFNGFEDDWEQRKLGEVAKIYDGTHQTPAYKNNGVMFLSVENIKNLSSDKYISVSDFERDFKIYPQVGDVLMTRIGDIGTANVVNTTAKVAYYVSLALFKSNYLNPYFLKECIHTRALQSEIWKRTLHIAFPKKINKNELTNIPINYPDLTEQYKIGVLFKTLDDTINLHNRKCNQLTQLKSVFLSKLFPKTGKSIPEIRFTNFDRNWEQRKLGMMISEFSDKSKIENEYIVFSSTKSGMEIRDGRVSGTSNIGYKIIKNGDLVLSPQNLWLGNININYIGTGLVSPSYKTFKLTDIEPRFFEPQLRTSKMLEEYKNSSTQGASVVRRNLELESFYQIQLLMPSLPEQSKIGNLFKTLDDTITLHNNKLTQLEELKKSMLSKLFI